MTDTNNPVLSFIKRLKKIDESILPITHQHKGSIDDHIEGLLNKFKTHLDELTENTVIDPKKLPVKAIVPAFCVINDWRNWEISEFENLYYLAYTDPEKFRTVYTAQAKISAKTVPFTTTVSNKVNNDVSEDGKTIIIEADSSNKDITRDVILDVKEDNKKGILRYSINNKRLEELKEKYRVPSSKELEPKISSNYDDLSLGVDKEYKQPEFDQRDFLDQSYSKTNLPFSEALKPAVRHHIFYIDEKFSLYYFFSKTVIKQAKSSKKDNKLGLGGLFVLLNKEYMGDENEERIISIFQSITNKLSNRIIHHYQIEENLKQTRKAAISQVMARNMSHNIGSHVLANLSTSDSLNDVKLLSTKVAKLNEYLKQRMDFLADIATTIPTFEVTKDLGYDVLKWLTKEGKKNKYEFILKHITGNSRNASLKIGETKNKYVGFPNDMLGVQAFYVIIENIIRNTAKHAEIDRNSFDIKFDIDEHEPTYQNFIGITIYDDCNGLSKNGSLVDDQNERIKRPMLKDDRLRPNAWGVLEMKIAAAYLRKIDPSDLDDDKYNPTGFVNGNITTETENNDIPPLIEAVNKESNLGYKIYLRKPKHLLFIDATEKDDDKTLGENQIRRLRQFGVWYKRWSKEDETILNENHSHDFLVLRNFDQDDIKKIKNHQKNFPMRKFMIENESCDISTSKYITLENLDYALNAFKEKKDANELYSFLWGKWIQKISKSKDIHDLNLKLQHKGKTTDSYSLVKRKKDEINEAILFLHKCTNFHDYFGKFYFEHYGSTSLTAPLIQSLKDLEDDPLQLQILKSKLCESILSTVAIIDERIQKIAEEENHPKLMQGKASIQLTKALKKTKLFIFPSCIGDLNASKYDNRLLDRIKDWLTKNSQTPDFLVIHLGILENICGTSNLSDDEKKEAILRCINDLQKENPSMKIIITSGRGRPDTLPDNTLFLHYSLISQYILENRSKFHLTQLLYSARKQK